METGSEHSALALRHRLIAAIAAGCELALGCGGTVEQNPIPRSVDSRRTPTLLASSSTAPSEPTSAPSLPESTSAPEQPADTLNLSQDVYLNFEGQIYDCSPEEQAYSVRRYRLSPQEIAVTARITESQGVTLFN